MECTPALSRNEDCTSCYEGYPVEEFFCGILSAFLLHQLPAGFKGTIVGEPAKAFMTANQWRPMSKLALMSSMWAHTHTAAVSLVVSAALVLIRSSSRVLRDVV